MELYGVNSQTVQGWKLYLIQVHILKWYCRDFITMKHLKNKKQTLTLGKSRHKCVYKTTAQFLITSALMASQLTSTHKTVTKWFWLSHSSAADPSPLSAAGASTPWAQDGKKHAKPAVPDEQLSSEQKGQHQELQCLMRSWESHQCWDCQFILH